MNCQVKSCRNAQQKFKYISLQEDNEIKCSICGANNITTKETYFSRLSKHMFYCQSCVLSLEYCKNKLRKKLSKVDCYYCHEKAYIIFVQTSPADNEEYVMRNGLIFAQDVPICYAHCLYIMQQFDLEYKCILHPLSTWGTIYPKTCDTCQKLQEEDKKLGAFCRYKHYDLQYFQSLILP